MELNAVEGYSPGPIAGMESGYREKFYGDLEKTHVNTHELNENALNFNGRGFVLSLLKQHDTCGPALAFVQRRWEVLMREVDYVGVQDAYIGGALNSAKKEWILKIGENERFWFNQLIEGILHDSLPTFTAQQIFDMSSRLYELVDPAKATPIYHPDTCVAAPADFDLIDNDHTIRKYLNEVRLNAWSMLQGNRTPHPMMTPRIGGAWGLDVPDGGNLGVGGFEQEVDGPGNEFLGEAAPATPPRSFTGFGLGINGSYNGDNDGDKDELDENTTHLNEDDDFIQSIESD